MKAIAPGKNYFYVDESGDPYFYDRRGKLVVGKEGCSKILILGFTKTDNPSALRAALENTRRSILSDEYLRGIPSVLKNETAFHATDDCPEVREKVFKSIRSMDTKAQFIVARKKEDVFLKRHKGLPNLFYDDLISKLFESQLHTADENIIYYAVRGNRARQAPLEEAIRTAIRTFEVKWKTKVHSEVRVVPQRPEGEPCLQITDYMNWALQRVFLRQEMRYLNFLREKVSLIVDVYDFKKYPRNYYSRKNPFDVNNISPL